jgi:DNA-binding IclR family transcriptional regulator
LYQAGQYQVDRLARDTGEVVNLDIPENGERVIIYGAEGENAVWDDATIGTRTPLNLTAIGKASLSSLSESELQPFFQKYNPGNKTEHSLSTQEEIRDDIESACFAFRPKYGANVRARTWFGQFRELLLKCAVRNVELAIDPTDP